MDLWSQSTTIVAGDGLACGNCRLTVGRCGALSSDSTYLNKKQKERK